MATRMRAFAAALALTVGTTAFGLSAQAEDGVKAGVLSCNVEGGWGFVFGSSKSVKCTYDNSHGRIEHYTGDITKYGVDIGYAGAGIIVWTVVAPTTEAMKPGSLAGEYGGATGGAAVGVGAGANVLLGGFNKSMALQPLSIQGMTGVNVAAGIGALTLKSAD